MPSRATAAVFLLALALSTTGCGGGEDSSSPEAQATPLSACGDVSGKAMPCGQ
jgi:hypothetical protein